MATSTGSLNDDILNFLQSKQVSTPKIEEKPTAKPIEPPRLVEAPKLIETKPIEVPKPPAKQIESPKVEDGVEIKVVDLPLGKTELIFQKVMDADDKLILCYKNDIELLQQVQIQLTEEMGEYVNASKQEPFEPEQGFPCLALFDGEWYRALCLSAAGKEATVLFVDFGNYETIEMKNIRKLPSHFALVPAVALICTVVGKFFFFFIIPTRLPASSVARGSGPHKILSIFSITPPYFT